MPSHVWPFGLAAIGGLTALYFYWWAKTHHHDHPAGSVLAHVWRPSHHEFTYPERDGRFGLKEYLDDRDDFGIALAGGGTKGMGFAHGAMRAMRETGILQRARYVSVSSGSAWFGIPFYYQSQDSVDEFLGKTLEVGELTPEKLIGSDAGKMITRLEAPVLKYWPSYTGKGADEKTHEKETLSEQVRRLTGAGDLPLPLLPPGVIKDVWDCLRDPCFCAASLLIPETSLENVWQYLFAELFLRPFGLTSRDAVYAQPSEVDRVQAQLGGNATIFATRDIKEDKLPFLVSQSAVFAPRTGTDAIRNPLQAFPYEHTPLYSGMVPAFADSKESAYYGLGDVLVEPFVSRSEVLQPLPSDSALADVPLARVRTFRNLGGLADWAGIATGAVQAFQMKAGWENLMSHGAERSFCPEAVVEKVTPHVPMWSPLNVHRLSKVPVTQTVPIGDAGIYDDLGHLPLLRRNVSKMVVFDTSAGYNSTLNEHLSLLQMSYLTAAFGKANSELGTLPGAPYANMPRDFLTVFEPAEFEPLWDEIQRLYKARVPVIVRGTYTTVANHHFGIAGGRKVDVVWVHGMDVKAWRRALPPKTDKMLPWYFPNYKVYEVVSQFQMSATSQFASWLGKQAIGEIEAMLGPVGPGNPKQPVQV